MSTATRPNADRAARADGWYGVSADEVIARLGVDPSVGLSSQKAAELL